MSMCLCVCVYGCVRVWMCVFVGGWVRMGVCMCFGLGRRYSYPCRCLNVNMGLVTGTGLFTCTCLRDWVGEDCLRIFTSKKLRCVSNSLHICDLLNLVSLFWAHTFSPAPPCVPSQSFVVQSMCAFVHRATPHSPTQPDTSTVSPSPFKHIMILQDAHHAIMLHVAHYAIMMNGAHHAIMTHTMH